MEFKFLKRASAFLAVLGLMAATSFAERKGDQAVGVVVGNPTGITYEMWLGEKVAFDLTGGVDRGEGDVHAALLWHNFTWSKNWENRMGFLSNINQNGDFPCYIGVGPRVLFEGNTEFGMRVPLGLAYMPHNSEWQFFGEVAPVMRFTPDFGFNGDISVGVRYLFRAIRPVAQ